MRAFLDIVLVFNIDVRSGLRQVGFSLKHEISQQARTQALVASELHCSIRGGPKGLNAKGRQTRLLEFTTVA